MRATLPSGRSLWYVEPMASCVLSKTSVVIAACAWRKSKGATTHLSVAITDGRTICRAVCATFRTNLDDTVSADENHPLRVDNDTVTGEPNPYIVVRAGLVARLNRPVFYQLVELGREERVGEATLFGVWSTGKFFPIGSLCDNP